MIKQIQKPIPFAEFLIKSQHYDWYKNKACCVDGCTKPACYAVNGHFYCDNHGVPSMQSLYVDLLKRRCKAAIRVELVSDHTNKEYPDYVQQAIDEYSTTPYTGNPKIVGLLTYVPDGKTPSVKELAECIMQNPLKVRYVTQGYTLQETAEILERVNKLVYANNKAHMFVTVWLGILEISTGKLTSASAGHEYPMINVNGKYELLKDKHGLAIGAMPNSKYKDTEITLHKGDSVFVYTDGVAEATDASNQLFGTDRTLEALNAIPRGVSQKEILAGVRTAVDAFVKEAPQFDDLTMLGLKYYGPSIPSESENA